MDEAIFDDGMQLERTALAWQRTLLTLAIGSLAAGRGLEQYLGPASWVIAGLGTSAGIVATIVARRRYIVSHKHLTTTDPLSLPHGAVLHVVAALLCLAAGLAALAFVLLRGSE